MLRPNVKLTIIGLAKTRRCTCHFLLPKFGNAKHVQKHYFKIVYYDPISMTLRMYRWARTILVPPWLAACCRWCVHISRVRSPTGNVLVSFCASTVSSSITLASHNQNELLKCSKCSETGRILDSTDGLQWWQVMESSQVALSSMARTIPTQKWIELCQIFGPLIRQLCRCKYTVNICYGLC